MDSVPPPPPDSDQKNIIDKLAQFVARNGPEFENMTKNKQKGNPKFHFLSLTTIGFRGQKTNCIPHEFSFGQEWGSFIKLVSVFAAFALIPGKFINFTI